MKRPAGLIPGRCASLRRAFTLLELLVAVAVIVVMAVLLLPALASAKARARQAYCANNLKQLAAAWTIYNGDNAGRIPSCVPFYVRGTANSNAWVLGVSSPFNLPNPYGVVETGVLDATNQNAISRGALFGGTKAAAAYRCPADSRAEGGVPYVRSYSMNNWMNGVPFAGLDPNSRDAKHRLFVKDSSIANPSQLYVFIDEDEGTINDAMFVTLMDPAAGVEDLPAQRHRSGYPVSFADGHGEIVRLGRAEEDQARLRAMATVSQ